MIDCDLHTHSRFFHRPPEVASWYDPYGVRWSLNAARRRGLDGLAVTNHDFCRRTLLDDSACLPGIEISTTRGHLLVIGEDPPCRTEPGELTPTEAVRLAHDHGCVAIIAHPFRNSTLRECDADFDAIEINGKHPEHRRRIETIARDRDLPVVAGSDAHFPFGVGRVFTRLDINELTPEAVVAAIRAGRVQPIVQDGPILRGRRFLYTGIHRAKGTLEDEGFDANRD